MSEHGPIPVPDATKSFWRTELDDLDSHRSTPTLPEQCDIVIIGAGFAGSALAHYIYEDNPSPPSVTILEAREACSGATARNGKSPVLSLICNPEKLPNVNSNRRRSFET
jgi:NADPH-dependent 2,4-dienoyl-CoA reductase/sulfur reductase-like enzyme